MAETVLFNIASKIFEILTPSILQGVTSIWGARDELRQLRVNVGIIKGVLLDAEQRQHNSAAVKEWLGTLRDVMYDADDLVDEFATEMRKQQLAKGKKLLKRVCVFLSSSNPIVFNVRLASRVKDIRTRLDVIITSTLPTFNFVVRDVEEQVGIPGRREQTYSFVSAQDVIGRDDDEKAIIEMLLDSEAEQNVSVIPIVGIGGLGKTALAQMVYNNEMVQKHFEVKLWLCIAEDFDVQLILKNIVRSITNKNVDELEFDELMCSIQGAVEAKKYLLVMDDIWNENREKWLRVKSILPSGGKGSKIIVTTRSRIVADIMGTVPKYELKGLSEDSSWSLFKKVALKPGQIESSPELVDIAMEIVKKCANVPLAIRTLGSLLYYKDTVREWLSIKDDELSKIKQDRDQILPVLRMSYNHLPSHLKHCFALCALFPKDYCLSSEWMINLWIAAGFIRPSHQNQSLEDAGEDCFLLLLRRGFFQDVEKDVSGRIIACRMHDLIHDLSQLVAGKEIVKVVDSDIRCLHDGVRYINLDNLKSTTWTLPPPLLADKKLRVFSMTRRQQVTFSKSTCDTLFTSFKFLRMLDLHSAGLKYVPRSIGELKLLIFLDLSSNWFITFLPNSFTRLLNLQILDLHNCSLLQRLPRDFSKLVSLIFVDIRDCHSLTRMSPGETQLPLLLQELSHLRFTKAIIDTRTVWRRRKQSLVTLTGVHLEDMNGTASPLHVRLDHGVLVRTQKLPASIEVLEFKYLQEEQIPSFGMDEPPSPLSNLAVIKFAHCLSFKHLPLFGRLPALKILIVQHLEALEYIQNEYPSASPAIFFPSLEELELFALPKLKGWSREAAVRVNDQQNHHLLSSFPLISRLRILDCPNLTSMPCVPNVKDLQLNNISEVLKQTLMNAGAEATASNSF